MQRSFLDEMKAARDAALTGQGDNRRRAGIVGGDVPPELVLACGLHPVRLASRPGHGYELGQRYLAGGADEKAKILFQMIVEGSFGDLDCIVFSHACETYVRVFYALREFMRLYPGQAARVPPLHFLDLLHGSADSTRTYNMVRARQLIAALGGCDDGALREALALYERHRAAWREIDLLRRQGRISGCDTLLAAAASDVMEPVQYGVLIWSLVGQWRSNPVCTGKKVLVTGSAHDHAGYYELIERHGLRVVGEDHDRAARFVFHTSDNEVHDPLAAIIDRFQRSPVRSAKFPASERARQTAARAREQRIAGVLCLVRAGDPAARWDVPDQQEALGELPFLLLDDLPYDPVPQLIDERIETWAAGLRHG
ncbi:MAG: 2-hydroxyacyl-CoA dehydratase [Gammaproteobacteria bacterium]|nr:2-hydroxyacyl-CoA dehydratase [Gammaproteobacteria bacterium]